MRTNCFKTEKDAYIFALILMDGRSRNEAIGIKKRMYYDSTKAKDWYDAIYKILSDDSIDTSFANEETAKAIENLQRLYDNMIDK